MSKLYYLIPTVLWLLQALFTFNSMGQLRGDELYTVRDIWPFAHRALAAAPGSNVTFYASIMILYNLFGFDLFMPKFFRLGLQFISLFCLAFLLKKYLGAKHAILPLVVIGLSPALLYWTVMEAPWGIDLQFLPICLFLIDTLSVKKKWTVLTGPVLGWITVMASWMAYPSFVFYLPFLVWFQEKKLAAFGRNKKVLWLVCLVAFLLPILAIYLYILRRDILFYDPKYERGLFTAGGAIMMDAAQFSQSTVAIFVNLFVKATSYVFEVQAVDFSHILPLTTFFFILFFSLKQAGKVKEIKAVVFWCLFTIIFNVVATGLMLDGSGMPGGRRSTPMLASLYGLFTISWYLIVVKKLVVFGKRWIGMAILSVLLAHHILVYPVNLVAMAEPSPFADNTWFALEKTPAASLKLLLKELQRGDITLDCEKQFKVSFPLCQYSSVYTILTEACYYNKLQCHNIKARLPYTNYYQTLNYELFAKDDWYK